MERASTYSLNLGGQLLELSAPQVMGILNATPDSFYAGSRRQTERDVADRTEEIVSEGAAIVDVGAYSTRPGAAEVSEEEELERLLPALSTVRRVAPSVPLSVDTFRASVVRRIADEFGAFVVNDVSGGADLEMFSTVARLGLPYVLTHSPFGIRSTTSSAPAVPPQTEGPILPRILLYMSERVDQLLALGQKDILLDPGFGFGKSLEENYELLFGLSALHSLRLPLLVGVSRKSMVYRLLGLSPEEALNGTTVLHTLALERGARLLRVHDVREAVEAIRIVAQLTRNSQLVTRNS